MGRPIPVRWKLFIPLCLFVMALIASPAAAEGHTIVVPLRADAPVIDGLLEEDHWTAQQAKTLTLDGTLRDDRTRTAELRVSHNATHLFFALTYTPGGGTHPDDHVSISFYDGKTADLLRYGWAQPVLLDDKTWNGTAWARDPDAGCGIDGAAARTEEDGMFTYELAKPLRGDACDAAVSAGDDLQVRIAFRENRPAPDHGDDFRWPRGSVNSDAAGDQDGKLDEVQEWATFTLESPNETPGETADETPDDASSGDGADEGSDTGSAGDGTTEGPDGAGAEGPGDDPTDGTQTDGEPGDTAESPVLPVLIMVLALLALAGGRSKSL